MKAIAILCQAALEQAVMAAESAPHGLETDDAYAVVSQEMIAQAVAAALEAGISPEAITRTVAETLVAARKGRAAA
jgi:hypothetical protein